MILELQHRRPDGDVDTYHLKPGRRYHLGRGSSCEVRILDLKLSRKHAAIEFLEGAWTLIDLCSTNGCRLNGETMVGTAPLATGATIEMGQTELVIGNFIPRNGALPSPAAMASLAPSPNDTNYHSDEYSAPAASPSGVNPGLSALNPTSSTDDRRPGSDSLRPGTAPVFNSSEESSSVVAKMAVAAAIAPTDQVPPARRVKSQAIKPVTLMAEPLASAPLASSAHHDADATVTNLPVVARGTPPPFVQPRVPTPLPSAPNVTPAAIPLPAANSDERSYFITVFGKRLGPLSRAVARDIKSRELKGTLKPEDLAQYPQA